MSLAFNAEILERTDRDGLHENAVSRVVKAMRCNLHEPMSLDDMADIACFSPYHFNRLFKDLTGVPPIQFLYALRLEQAKRLLTATQLTVTEICFEVGYNSLGSFTNRFTELVGLSPMAYRRIGAELKGFSLRAIRGAIDDRAEIKTGGGVDVRLLVPAPFEGLIFSGLFRRAIPEHRPVTCVLTREAGRVRFPTVPDGRYFALSVAVPWNTTARELLNLDGAYRGRSRVLQLSKDKVKMPANVLLAAEDLFHPPILTVLPIVQMRKLAHMATN